MKIEDLTGKWAQNYAIGHNPILIVHTNSKTCKFWPTGIDQDEKHHKLNGWWICDQTGDPILQEQIKIKKEDLVNWHIVDE